MKCTYCLLYLHFDIWIRVTIRIHGRQMDAAHNAYNEAVLLGAVHQGYQNPTTLFYLCAVFPRLWQREEVNSSVGFMIKICINLWGNPSCLDMCGNRLPHPRRERSLWLCRLCRLLRFSLSARGSEIRAGQKESVTNGTKDSLTMCEFHSQAQLSLDTRWSFSSDSSSVSSVPLGFPR